MKMLEHHYGENIHILDNPYLHTLLGRLGREQTKQPELTQLLETLYQHLLEAAISTYFPTEQVEWDTRMKAINKEGVFKGTVIKESTPAVCVDLARAGIYPSHYCFHQLHSVLSPENIRQDHFFMNRKTNANNEVIGVDVSGSKIGGGQEGAMVLLPDPMGATGSSLSYCVDHFKENVPGKALKYIGLHIIVTPEFVKRMQQDHPEMAIFSVRLDRGLSDNEVLNSTPGTFWDKEKGLNDNQYIVPGAGGVGEILNNSYC